MSHDPGASDASLHALLFELTTLSPKLPGVRMPRPRVTIAPYKKQTTTPTNASQNTTSAKYTKLPDYGFGDLEKMATDIIGMESLTTLAQIVQQQCRLMSDFKHTDECKVFLEKTCGREAPRLRLDHNTLAALGSPVIELALLLFQYSNEDTKTFRSLLPPADSTVIASVATAGSGRESEWGRRVCNVQRACTQGHVARRVREPVSTVLREKPVQSRPQTRRRHLPLGLHLAPRYPHAGGRRSRGLGAPRALEHARLHRHGPPRARLPPRQRHPRPKGPHLQRRPHAAPRRAAVVRVR